MAKRILMEPSPIRIGSLVLAMLVYTACSCQSSGDVDTQFNSEDMGDRAGYHLSGLALALAVQPDGRILCAQRSVGSLALRYSQHYTGAIFRLHPNGTLDDSFSTNPGFGMNPLLRSITLQPDGKLLVCGTGFTNFGGIPCENMVRLNADGSLDTTFQSPDPGSQIIHDSEVLDDGRILIVGTFLTINGEPHHGIARLMPDGSLDGSFQTGTLGATTNFILTSHVQTDGGLLIGGRFDQVAGHAVTSAARLLPDGQVDTTFTPPSFTTHFGEIGTIRKTVVLSNGRIVLAGSFSFVDSVLASGTIALMPNGDLDTAFTVGEGFHANCCTTPSISDMIVDNNDRSYLVGNFNRYQGITHSGVIRLLPNGTPDPTFNSGTGVNDGLQPSAYAVALASNGGVIAIGQFSSFDNTVTRGIVHILENGQPDQQFDPGTGANSSVYSLALQADAKILVGGNFSHMNGERKLSLARLHPDGTLDQSFEPPDWSRGAVSVIKVLQDGRILVGGVFGRVGNTPGRVGLVRLLADGSLDSTFQLYRASNAPVAVADLEIQPDGRIVIVGQMTHYHGEVRSCMARLLPDGGLDPTFTTPQGGFSEFEINDFVVPICLGVKRVVLQNDGKLVVCGSFDGYGAAARTGIARINVDGSLDTSFETEGLFEFSNLCTSFLDLTLDPSGNIILSGSFGSFEGPNFVRLTPNGEVDTTFSTDLSTTFVSDVLQLDSGGYLVARSDWPNMDIVRLGPDGQLDPTYRSGPLQTGLVGNANALLLDQSGGLIIGGEFFHFDGIGRNNLVRLDPLDFTTSVTPPLDRPQVSIHPNPLRGSLLNYDLGSMVVSHMDVYNSTGKLLQRIPLVSRTATGSVELNELPSGSYYVTLVGERETHTRRLTILQ
jgi:uncharacterized delta-60 repeat protein